MHGTNKLRWLFVAITVIAFLWGLFYAVHALMQRAEDIQPIKSGEIQRKIGDNLRHDAEINFQLAVLLLGGVWGAALMSDRERLRRKDFPELIMFIIVLLLFVSFFFLNKRYIEILDRSSINVASYNKDEIPDYLHSPAIVARSEAATDLFYALLAASGIMIFSLRFLRELPSHETTSPDSALDQ